MIIIGIDEVGRGCLAGPLVAGAVILDGPVIGLKDSKKLTKFQRAQIARLIDAQAQAIGLGWVTSREVDSYGLTEAVRLAMHRAVAEIRIPYDEIIIDGGYNFLSDMPGSRAVIRADDTVPAASAASVVAKVARDAYMEKVSLQYPGYGFERHVGYGTELHMQKMHELGLTPEHRMSFRPVQTLNIS